MKRVYINFGVSSFISQLTDSQFTKFLGVVTTCYERRLCCYSFCGADLRIEHYRLTEGLQSYLRLIIPMNMRDGSLICIGKGNDDWNQSAPHGAGRLMSRRKAKDTLNLVDFEKSMDGIFTTSVCQDTIDESPMVYKPMDEIIECIEDTVRIEEIIKPVYNFKAAL